MKKCYALLSFIIILSGTLSADEYLRINNVRYWWSYTQGNIDSASILVEPKGVFAECTLLLTFSAGESMFAPTDSLEAEMNFKLPAGSEINDLYLWINGEPVRAKLYDRWTASLIYESIVKRRKDPAILTKTGTDEYNIRIFPLLNDLPRKIRLRYLVPVSNLLSSQSLVNLPLDILHLSLLQPGVFRIACKPSEQYGSVQLLEEPDAKFTPVNDPDFGDCLVKDVSGTAKFTSLNLVLVTNSQSAIQMYNYQDSADDEKYYQLCFRQSELFNITKPRKALFMVDYIDQNCSAYSSQDILDQLEYSIRQSFTSKDSFNIIFSGMVSTFPGHSWIAADSASISGFFDSLNISVFNSYSNLPTLLIDGIDFIKNNGGEGSLVLLSSSNSNGGRDEANSLVSDFLNSLQGTEIPIHIIDLDDQYYDYSNMHYIGGQYFRGNEYFYSRLSQLTVGEYYSIRNSSLLSMLEGVGHRISGYFKSVEVLLKTTDGYAFSNYRLSNDNGLVYNDEAICMSGRYIGTAPFVLTVYGQNEQGDFYQIDDTITMANITGGDSLIKVAWGAQKIRDMYSLDKSNQVISQIINTSIDVHVLSDYTAFLVLEPNYRIPDNLDDNSSGNEVLPTGIIESSTPASGTYKLESYPNPFSTSATITFEIPDRADVRILLYNTTGQIVATLLDRSMEEGQHKVSLEAGDVVKGVYYCTMIVNGQVVAREKLVRL